MLELRLFGLSVGEYTMKTFALTHLQSQQAHTQRELVVRTKNKSTINAAPVFTQARSGGQNVLTDAPYDPKSIVATLEHANECLITA